MTDHRAQTFASAVRAVIAEDPDLSDMRGLARQALDLLSEDLVYEAAVTHLTGLARREWNRSVRDGGGWSIHSDEIVNVRGQDVMLGDTDQSDREWLASHRESLAAGLSARAVTFRTCGEAGPGSLVPLTTAQVLAAERRASQQAALADALDAMSDAVSSGAAAEWNAIEVAEIRSAADKWRGWLLLYADLADRLESLDLPAGMGFGKSRRSINRMTAQRRAVDS